MPPAKKHHFVPQFLLRRFADEHERLVVHRLAMDKSFIATVRNTGHRNFGHSIIMPGREPDHTSLEKYMSAIEGEAASAITDLSGNRRKMVPNEHRDAIAWLLALQWQRSRFLFHSIRKETPEYDDTEVDQTAFLASMLLMIESSVIFPWMARNDEYARPKEQWNALVSVLLDPHMHWSCYRPHGLPLIASDNIVCFSGARDGFFPNIPKAYLDHGIGVGFWDFRRVTVPLGSNLGLIISRDSTDAVRMRAAEFNRYTVFNSREFVAHSPEWDARHPRLKGELRENMRIQKWISPVFLREYSGQI
ncbi:DUF4238 domain-containing protein [Actinoallomurus sp. CA-142502]|uniref:DUF4238 domain-containing protein n=1 Tax=Actinoallomurus sp. CA-142502 TaxID=3239885 RepID=UPI003D946F43